VDDAREGSWSWCCEALSCLVVAVGGGAFSKDVKSASLNIWWRVDRMGTCNSGNESPRAWLPGAQVCPELGYKVRL
jgi:hypothetical protein